MGYGGLGEGDYSSVDGQKHIHNKCICRVPGLLKRVNEINITDPGATEQLQQIKEYLQESCPDEFFQQILVQYNKLQNI